MICCPHLTESAGDSSEGVPWELLASLERLQQALLEEEDPCMPHEGEEEGTDKKGSSGEGAQTSSNLKELRTVVSSLLTLLQRVEEEYS